MVFQDVYLFNESLIDNMYGNQKASDDEIKRLVI